MIKKYENRRLYDTETSAYVNLDDLARKVRAGEAIVVVDAKSGEDLTREVLLQVLLAQPGGPELLPVGMLRRVIRCTGDDAWNRMLRTHLTSALELLHTQMDAMEGQLARVRPPEPTRAPEPPRPAEADAEMEELRARLAALEGRLRG